MEGQTTVTHLSCPLYLMLLSFLNCFPWLPTVQSAPYVISLKEKIMFPDTFPPVSSQEFSNKLDCSKSYSSPWGNRGLCPQWSATSPSNGQSTMSVTPSNLVETFLHCAMGFYFQLGGSPSMHFFVPFQVMQDYLNHVYINQEVFSA